MVLPMSKLIVISVRIPVELKRKIDKYGIRVSDVVRRSLEEEVRKREVEELKEEISKISHILKKVPPESILEDI